MTNQRRRPNLTREEIDRAIELREQHGWSVPRCARAIGCSASALDYHFLKLGVDGPAPPPLSPVPTEPVAQRRNGRIVRRFTVAEDAELLDLESQGVRVNEIARRLGRRPNSVRQRLMTLARREERISR